MKLILSRKGFDASAGGVPSAILPSGALCFLPIPEPGAQGGARRYADLAFEGQSLGVLVHDLTRGGVAPDATAHLDPDLNAIHVPRAQGWRPVFGQAAAAETHLQGQGVSAGDLFLFFGWFRQVERAEGRTRYVAGAPDLHVLFGWLQVERRIAVDDAEGIPAWAREHPHCRRPPYHGVDCIYVARERLALPGLERALPGGGVFPRFDAALCLTAPGRTRSHWRLPGWFAPEGRRSRLSYHGHPERWTADGDHVLLHTVGRGQEFVLDCDDYPEARGWLAGLFQAGSKPCRR